MCARHRTLSPGLCPECAEDRRARRKLHDGARGKKFRLAILERDDYRCHWNLPGCEKQASQVDYIRALVDGGTPYDPENAVASCRSCNAKRGAALSNGGYIAGGGV
jgi:5-methylcytosine-specific restriction endonuclease McrA